MTTPVPLPRRAYPFPSRRLRRASGALALVLALGATGACELRLGEGSPASLPSASTTEVARDALARQATLIGSTATVVSVSTQDTTVASAAAALGTGAASQVTSLGGVWEPWPTAVPTSYPTASAVATAAADATVEDLTAALANGVTMAAEAAVSAEDAQSARLFTSLAVSWAVSLEELSPGSVTGDPAWEGRDPGSLESPLFGSLLRAYDAARYALEEVAARSDTGSDQRTRAADEAEDAKDLVFASVALGGDDTRLSAYAPPSAATDPATSLDVTWARQVREDVLVTEVQGVGEAATGSQERTAGVSAAVHAGLLARAWGSDIGTLPGYTDPGTT